jgi:hypothetical protein
MVWRVDSWRVYFKETTGRRGRILERGKFSHERVATKVIGGNWGGGLVLLRPVVALVETTGDNEGELGRGETIAPTEGTVIQWASPGHSSLPGHDASLDKQRRDGHG